MEIDSRGVKVFKIIVLCLGGWLVAIIIQAQLQSLLINILHTWIIIFGTFFLASIICYFWIRDSKKKRLILALLMPVFAALFALAILAIPLLVWSAGSSG